MLAYLSTRPSVAARDSNPNLMLAVIAVHVAAVALVMSAKMDLPTRLLDRPIKVDLIEDTPPPPPHPQQPPKPQVEYPRDLTVTDPIISPIEDSSTMVLPDPQANVLPPDPIPDSIVVADPPPRPIPATPAFLMTGANELKPPYPASRLASGEEATLKLRLTIAPSGRVIAVDSIGRADPVFLAAARNHILGHWRYRPASENGHDVSSTLVISLRFQLDG